MRILYDARSARTPAGMYVLRGLTAGWRADARVSHVFACSTTPFAPGVLPAGVEPIVLRDRGWLRYLLTDVTDAAAKSGADVIFSPNATPPRDPRSVMYFQDMKHLRRVQHQNLTRSERVGEMARSMWRRVAAPKCKLGVAVSQDIATEAASRMTSPVVVIPNGVDVGNRRWAGGDHTVLVMGGIGPWKGEALAIRAWSRLDAPIRAGLHLEICGVEPASRRAELSALADASDVAGSVKITGMSPREAFLDRITTARLAVSCSLFEAFGLPVAEALAIGAPVLCSDLPAHLELLGRAHAGQSFPTNSEQALTQSLRHALNGSPPPRVEKMLSGWSWMHRASEHIDQYAKFV